MRFICLALVLACAHTPATADPQPDPYQCISGPAEGVGCSARILFNTPVTEDSVEAAVASIQAANDAGAKFILMEINSPGGSVNEGFKLAKAIEGSRAPVTCLVDGLAASMSHYILQSCRWRGLTRRSTLMLHDAAVYGEFGGQSRQWSNIAERLRVLSEALAQHQCARVRLPFEACRSRFSDGREWWVTADEALTLGLVDFIRLGPEYEAARN